MLMYHNVGYEPADRGTILPSELASQWRSLQQLGYVNVSMDQIRRQLAAGALPEGRTFAITFDDGRHGVYEHGLPLLQSFGFSAIVYLVSGLIGTTRCFSGLDLTYMSLDQIRMWAAAGQSVGSHTLTHQHLPSLGEPELRQEIVDSARTLESQFEMAGGASHFAYPYGEYDQKVEEAAAACHVTAVTVEQSAVLPTSRLMAIPRVDPGRRRDEMILRFANLDLL